jgi:hypothetical protein
LSRPSQTAIIVDETHNLKAVTIKKIPREIISSFIYDNKLLTLKYELSKAFFPFIQPDCMRGFEKPANLEKIQLVISDLLPKLKKEHDPDYSKVKKIQQFLLEPGTIWFTEKDKLELGHINLDPTTVKGNFLHVSRIILMSGTIFPPQIYTLLFQLKTFKILSLIILKFDLNNYILLFTLNKTLILKPNLQYILL